MDAACKATQHNTFLEQFNVRYIVLKNNMIDIMASYFVDQFLEASFLSKSSEMILVVKTLAKLKNKITNIIASYFVDQFLQEASF